MLFLTFFYFQKIQKQLLVQWHVCDTNVPLAKEVLLLKLFAATAFDFWV
jgi:hypothetical protein